MLVHTPPVGLGNRYPPGAVNATRVRTYSSSAAGTGTVRVWCVLVGPNTAPLVRFDCVAARCTRTPRPCGVCTTSSTRSAAISENRHPVVPRNSTTGWHSGGTAMTSRPSCSGRSQCGSRLVPPRGSATIRATFTESRRSRIA